MTFKLIGIFIGLFLLVGVFASSFVSAGNVILKTVPVQKVWNADGVTEYRMDVYADNAGLNGLKTAAIDWKIVASQQLQPYITMTHFNWVSFNDFFVQYMPNSVINSVNGWGPNSRVVTMNGGGVSNKQGLVASYWFTVNLNAPTGLHSFDFDMDYTDALAPNGAGQSLIVQNVPFRITNLNKHLAVSSSELCPVGQTC